MGEHSARAVARGTDRSEFTEISLQVYRSGHESLTWAVNVKTVGGGLHRVRMVTRGQAPSPRGSDAARDPLAALRAVLRQLE